MVHRSPFARWLVVVVAALQVLLAPAASVADGWLQRDQARARPTEHVESPGSTACARIHADDCALCSVVSALASPGRSLSLPACVARLHSSVADAALPVARPVDHALPGSRAPPRPDRFDL